MQKQNNAERPSFPHEVFPKKIIELILSAENCLGFSSDIVATAMLVAASIAIGSSLRISRKRGYDLAANLFAVVIAPSGSKKSPAMKFGLHPLTLLEKEYFKEYKNELKSMPAGSKIPARKTLFTNDITMEALMVKLENNPNGIGVMRDELLGWIKDMNQYRGGSDIQKYLTAYDGNSLSISRKTNSEERYIENPFVTVFGSIQNEITPLLFSEFLTQHGLTPRFLVAIPNIKPRTRSSGEVEAGLQKHYSGLITTLHNKASIIQKSKDNYRIIHLSPSATKIIDNYEDENNERINNSVTSDAECSIYSKLEAYTLKFCLLLESISCASRGMEIAEISMESAAGAIKLETYFRKHHLFALRHNRNNYDPIEVSVSLKIIKPELSFESISKITDVPHSTIHKRYSQYVKGLDGG